MTKLSTDPEHDADRRDDAAAVRLANAGRYKRGILPGDRTRRDRPLHSRVGGLAQDSDYMAARSRDKAPRVHGEQPDKTINTESLDKTID
eukprot:COSAG06_NODE_37918_length_429_cov_1.248485_1_plen_90_part_00